jgi:arabinoxylan arabinofuranohydrolase
LKNPGNFFGTYGNNHHCLVKFLGKWYMFYHSELLRKDMQLPANGYRCVHVDETTVEKDGTIMPVTATRAGVRQLKYLDPFVHNEAETIAWMGGISVVQCIEKSPLYGKTNLAVGEIETGDWTGLSKVDFGNKGAISFTARVSGGTEGNLIKICLDKPDGDAIGYLKIPQTGGVNKYQSVTTEIKTVKGVHDLFFVFAGQGFEFDSWKFDCRQ